MGKSLPSFDLVEELHIAFQWVGHGEREREREREKEVVGADAGRSDDAFSALLRERA